MANRQHTGGRILQSIERAISGTLRRSTVLAAALALSTAMATPTSMALTSEAELDRYLLAAKKYIETEQYDKAHTYLEKAGKLSLDPPAEYHFYLGKVLDYNNDDSQARKQFELYVNAAGREGEFYSIALEKITEIEEIETSREAVKKAFESQNSITKSAISTTAPTAEGDNFDDSLQVLYATSSKKEALIKHINTILKSKPYSGGTVQTQGSRTGIHYKISLGSNSEIVVTKQDRRKQPARITTEKTNIYGMNPFIQHECDISKGSCWVKNPDGYGKWVEFAYDEKDATDLAKTFTSLIRELQGSNK